jgi:sugar-phosphatase
MLAVALDVDGVLIDSAAVHRAVWATWAQTNGLDPEHVWQATFGRRPEDTVREIASGLEPADEVGVLNQLLATYEHRIKAMPGAISLLSSLVDGRWAVVTSGNRAATTRRFRRLDLPMPSVSVFGEDVPRGKPAPDCYRLAAKKLGVAPSDCVVVEDAPAGIEAGVQAGCRVFAVTTTHSRSALSGADEVHDNLSEIGKRLGSGVCIRPSGRKADGVRREF